MSRIEDILQKMTLEEKIAQLQCTMSLGAGIDERACPNGLG